MGFEADKARIFDALLKHRGLQHLVDVGSDVLGNPLFVCDLAAQVLAMSHADGSDREFWEGFFPQGRMDPDNALVVGRAGIYDQIFSADLPVWGKFDFFPGQFVGARLRARDHVIGMATLVGRNPLTLEDGDLLVVLCQALVMEMTFQESNIRSSSALHDVIVRAIEGDRSYEDLNLQGHGARLDLPTPAKALVIELGSTHPGPLLALAQSQLAQWLPTSPVIIYHERLVMLLDGERHQQVPLQQIERCLGGTSARIGMGCPFETIDGVGLSYRQARAALALSQASNSPALLVDYEDWRIDDFMAHAASLMDLTPYLDPALLRIHEHDRREGTFLATTLDTYLRCANNAQAAARLLGIHKNTMYARLDRIQRLFDINLESGETCLSLACALHMERAMELQKELNL